MRGSGSGGMAALAGRSVARPVARCGRAGGRSARGVRCAAASIADFSADSIDGNPVELKKYLGKVCLVVNVASA